jgi:hypothetical protein
MSNSTIGVPVNPKPRVLYPTEFGVKRRPHLRIWEWRF